MYQFFCRKITTNRLARIFVCPAIAIPKDHSAHLVILTPVSANVDPEWLEEDAKHARMDLPKLPSMDVQVRNPICGISFTKVDTKWTNFHIFCLIVVYDGCPRNFADGVWWKRTEFGKVAVESCPRGSQGKASRICDNTSEGWQNPDIFNCTSDSFTSLRKRVRS